MRRKKHKQTRRATNYYRINYGFHEPYKVLLDGNFIHATKAINMGDLATHLPKLLGGTCKIYTTKCVTRELRSMGHEFAASAAAARAYALHKCDHGDHGAEHEEDGGDAEEEGQAGDKKKAGKGKGGAGCVPAAECIKAAIGKRNEGHWFVATQDAALRQALAQIPGCPLVFATVNGVHLETPSEVSKQKAKEAEAATRSLAKHERAAEPLLREEQLAELRKQQRMRQAGGAGGMPPPTTSARFRRNKAKGPNPLAAKKKIKKVSAAPAKNGDQTKAKAREKGQGKAAKRKAAGPEADGDAVAAAVAAQQQREAKRRRKRSIQAPAGGGATEKDE